MFMRRVVFFALILSVTGASAQVISITKFYHNGKDMEMVSHGVPHLSFHESDTSLTEVTKGYLDVFGRYYRDSVLSDRQYIINLAPATDVERGRDDSLGIRRAMVVIRYLNDNYSIGERNFRIRLHQTVTTVCEGFVGKERHPKRAARRERRKLKKEEGGIDEDAYFKE
jgi:hypothetical protein